MRSYICHGVQEVSTKANIWNEDKGKVNAVMEQELRTKTRLGQNLKGCWPLSETGYPEFSLDGFISSYNRWIHQG